MLLKKWIIKGKHYLLPADWDKEYVVSFCNTGIKVCQYCGKVDISLNHFEKVHKTS